MINAILAKLQVIHILAPGLLLALSMHELSHGVAAYILGDNTAKKQGRLTLNPIAHLDLLGTLALLFFPFGWAKPVPVNPYNFKSFKRGYAITAAAGPLANFILAGLFAGLFHLLMNLVPVASVSTSWLWRYVFQVLYFVIQINLILGLFNLIPIPPLDGSKILGGFLPDRLYWRWLQYERYSFGILMGLMALNWVFELNIFGYIIVTPLRFVMHLLKIPI